MTDQLIICEKPAAAKKIAEALADGGVTKKNEKGVPFYEIRHASKDILVGAAVGHLFGLGQKDQEKGYTYPIFDIEWLPSSSLRKESAYTKKYADVLKKLCKGVKELIVATDYDVEGEVIGLNIVRHLCKRKDAKRMKFSTLTKQDLVKAYANASAHLDWPQAEAGETRHLLDFYYGINVSRALTSAIKTAGTFKVLSAGRVQGPALKIIVDRDKLIKAFIAEPYWEISLLGEKHTHTIEAMHEKGKFFDKNQADTVMKTVKGAQAASVTAVDRKQFNQSQPTPFDLTTLQTESYRCFGISPKQTLELAQDLYTGGFISYPRTSSQQLPVEIGFKNILSDLSRHKIYAPLTQLLLKQPSLQPNNGKKKDPAHPAIFPTGVLPFDMSARHMKVYDLIVKRFFATFSTPAKRETMTVTLDVKKEVFIAKGTRTVEKGWHVLYAPYVKVEETELPELKRAEHVMVKKISMAAKKTQPPKRYTEASIIKELEKRSLGTKATRASIIETLKSRNYIKGRKALEATELGYQTLEVLEKFTPRIVDEELTRSFEERMESILEGKQHQPEILKHAREMLTELLADFKKKEKSVGEQLKETFGETRTTMKTVGTCPACEGNLVIKKGKFGRFIACSNYPECTQTFHLPNAGMVETTSKTCDACNHPIIIIIRKGKRPQELCINESCPKKAVDEKKIAEHMCPVCQKGKMMLRKSVYGSFLGCSRYPQCKTTQRINPDGSVAPVRVPAVKKKTTKKNTEKTTVRKQTTPTKKRSTKTKSSKK